MLQISNFAPPRQQALKANNQRDGAKIILSEGKQSGTLYTMIEMLTTSVLENTSSVSDDPVVFVPKKMDLVGQCLQLFSSIADPEKHTGITGSIVKEWENVKPTAQGSLFDSINWDDLEVMKLNFKNEHDDEIINAKLPFDNPQQLLIALLQLQEKLDEKAKSINPITTLSRMWNNS
jgi:hypothetical protein